jgi:CHASE2 domain-containing sensor protein
MIRNKLARRVVAIGLMGVGGVLILLAPAVWVGAIPLALGLSLEVIGIMLEHKGEKRSHRPRERRSR